MAARHRSSERGQLDLFRALPGDFAPRDAQDLMAYPFFSLSKSHRIAPINFSAGGIAIRVEAVPDHGMATIWDADILIWAASQIVEARDAGLRTSRLMAATPYEILTFVGRGTSMRDYQRLKAALVLAYLFHRIEDRLDGSPTLIIVDEGWLALDDEGFAGQLREWLKTLRKKNASVIFATQSLSDIDGSSIAPAIIESCQTRLLLPNERAIEPQITAIYRRFGLNDRQIEILARATPKRDYYCQSRRGNRLFELGLSDVALALCAASSRTDQQAIAAIVAEHGHAGFLAAWLRHRGVGWAADLIPDLTNLEPEDQS